MAAVLLGLGGPPAAATTQDPVTVAQLTREADLVAVLRPVHAGSFQQGTHIHSLVGCQVLEVWRDSPHRQQQASPGLVDVLLLGGVVGDLGQHVFGGASLPENQPQVVFLRWARSGTGEWQVVGLGQGVCGLGGAAAAWPVAADTPVRCQARGAATTLGGLSRQVQDAVGQP